VTSKKVSLTRTVAAEKRTINVLVREAGKKNVVPVQGAEVRITTEGGKVMRTGKTNALGRFRADDMPAGVYVVRADKTGYTQLQVARADVSRRDDQPEVLLQSKDVATDPKKPDPAPGLITVPNVVKAPQGRAKTLIEGAGLAYAVANPKAQGEVASQKPAAGEKVKKGTTVSVTLGEVKPAPTTRTLTVTALMYGTNKPMAGATMTVKNAQKKVVGTGKTDAQGKAQFSNLPPGVYTVEGAAGEYSTNTPPRADLTSVNAQVNAVLSRGPIVK
jgi:uncharacterized protein YfaS (alpha-2-macroglobulin family)